jgi:putative acetyltransferase
MATNQNILIRHADIPDELETLRTLLREYAHALNAEQGGEHICVVDFEKELATLPGKYGSPSGAMLVAWVDGTAAGCVMLRPLDPAPRAGEQACEMKRLWVRTEFRGLRLGRLLTEAAIDFGRRRGYTAMYLDTAPATMQAANHLYRNFGFEAVERYHDRQVFGGADQATAPQVAFFRKVL